MSDAYNILGLKPDADEAEIRKRYLELVREFPPDRAPERFAAIREAYDEVRDPHQRLEALLFDLSTRDTLESLISDLRARMRDSQVPLATLLKLAESP
jgi:curved DNA-binding protein CbpA